MGVGLGPCSPAISSGLFSDSQSDRVIELARVTSSDIVCDLGFGDAQFLLHVAASTGCRCIGCEVNGDLVAQAAAKVVAAGEVGSRVALSQAHANPTLALALALALALTRTRA